MLGKFLGCWLACGLCLLVFYVFFGVVCGLREHHWPVTQYFQAMWLHWCLLAVVTAMTLFGSVVFAAPSSTNTIILVAVTGILLLGRHLHKISTSMSEPAATILAVCYYTMPHLEFYDVRDLIIHDWPVIAWWVWGAATLYGIGYTALFLFAAWLKFRRQALN